MKEIADRVVQLLRAPRGIAVAATFLFGIIFTTFWFFYRSEGFQSGLFFDLTTPSTFFIDPSISLLLARLMSTDFGFMLSLVGSTFLPSTLMALTVGILSRHLSILWSVSLTLLALLTLSELPFRDFLIGMATGRSSFPVSDVFPQAMVWPIPIVPTLLFVILYMLGTKLGRLSFRAQTYITAASAALIYLNPFDAYLAISFWIGHLMVQFALDKLPKRDVIRMLGAQILVALVVVLPALIGSDFTIEPTPAEAFPIWYVLFVHFLAPLALLVAIVTLARVDTYEIVSRFRSVFILMLAEFGLILISSVGVISLNITYLQSQTPLFFTHILFWTPVIYYASRPGVDAWSSSKGRGWRPHFRRIFFLAFNTLSLYLLPVVIALMVVYAFLPIWLGA